MWSGASDSFVMRDSFYRTSDRRPGSVPRGRDEIGETAEHHAGRPAKKPGTASWPYRDIEAPGDLLLAAADYRPTTKSYYHNHRYEASGGAELRPDER